VVFDGDYESGNLDRVVQVSPHEYNLYIRPDTLSPRYGKGTQVVKFIWHSINRQATLH
jgi:hypothetical protein